MNTHEVENGDQCPVCGWATIRTEGVREHPDGDHPNGIMYVHRIESKGRSGHFKISGCTLYSDGETECWDPEK